MHPVRQVGVVFTGLSLVGYAIGTAVAYPGRAVTIVGLMVGIALVAMGGAGGPS